MSKPRYWPSNLSWNDSYVIVAELESYPPVYVLNTGTRIKGELPLSEYKRVTYIPKKSRKSRKSRKSKKSKKSRRKSKKSRRKSRKSRKSRRKSKKSKRKSKRRY